MNRQRRRFLEIVARVRRNVREVGKKLDDLVLPKLDTGHVITVAIAGFAIAILMIVIFEHRLEETRQKVGYEEWKAQVPAVQRTSY